VPATNVTPVGNVPVSLSVGAGVPVAVTVNVPAAPTVNVVLLALVITGAVFTVSVKLCVAFGVIPFAAVIVIGYTPPVPAPGVPLNNPAVLKVTPPGSAPVSLNVDAGKPDAVTVKLPAPPTVKVVLVALVIAGAWSTVNVKFCVALVPTPLLAVNVMGYALPVPAAGVPLSVPVPGEALKVTPAGSVPDSVIVGVGVPTAVTVNVPDVPTVKVVLVALVNPGAVFTVSVKLCVAFGKMPFAAATVMA